MKIERNVMQGGRD